MLKTLRRYSRSAQFAFGDRLLRMTIGGREQSNVDFDLLAAAESSDGALLDDAQEFRLKQRRHFADLVEQQRAGIGELETACAARSSAGERSFFVSEQFDSINDSGIAEQLIATNGRSQRGLIL